MPPSGLSGGELPVPGGPPAGSRQLLGRGNTDGLLKHGTQVWTWMAVRAFITRRKGKSLVPCSCRKGRLGGAKPCAGIAHTLCFQSLNNPLQDVL